MYHEGRLVPAPTAEGAAWSYGVALKEDSFGRTCVAGFASEAAEVSSGLRVDDVLLSISRGDGVPDWDATDRTFEENEEALRVGSSVRFGATKGREVCFDSLECFAITSVKKRIHRTRP